MGTTAVAALVTGSTMTVGSAGDSRCYLLRDGKLTQVTKDDSWVSAAWAEGILNADEIERHPLKNVITKAVGAKETIEIEVSETQLQNGDVVLICSDGLHGMINDEEILRILVAPAASLQETAGKLIDAANEAGGKDNVSVVLLRYTE
jgi:protein phosphatase